MGRNPLPDKVKQVRGTERKSRKRGDVGQTVELLDVKVPAHLKGEAKKIYELKVRQCFAMGILSEIDVDALAIYAWEYSELLRLAAELKDEGYVQTVEIKNGSEVKINPKEKVVARKIATVNALGSQFGWSPVSRMRLQAIAKEEEKKDDFQMLING
jgi:P27 family predicted phage terminase small subunit